MKQEDTKQKILEKALELFSVQGYDAVSVGEIAKAVGIKAPSLYNHFPSKQAIFDAIVESTEVHYTRNAGERAVHIRDAGQDVPVFDKISEDDLVEKVRRLFLYTLHDETVSRFRRMMTIEQFRSPELAALYTRRYVEWMLEYHTALFRSMIREHVLRDEAPETLAMMYVSPVFTLLGICDRQPEREAECLAKLEAHVRLFFRTFNLKK